MELLYLPFHSNVTNNIYEILTKLFITLLY